MNVQKYKDSTVKSIYNVMKEKGLIVIITMGALIAAIITLSSVFSIFFKTILGPILLGFFLFFTIILFITLKELVSKANDGSKFSRIIWNFRYDIQPDGNAIWEVRHKIEAISDTLEIYTKRLLLWADSTIEDFIKKGEVKLVDGPPGTHIYSTSKLLNPQRLESQIRFVPPLKKGQQAEIISEYEGKCVQMDSDSILGHIKSGVWPLDEPYEVRAYTIKCPTEELFCSITFPKGYPIMDAQVKVYYTFPSQYEYVSEYERIVKEGKFLHKEVDSRHSIVLQVLRPFIGLTYAILWKPPPFDIYQKFLRESGKCIND